MLTAFTQHEQHSSWGPSSTGVPQSRAREVSHRPMSTCRGRIPFFPQFLEVGSLLGDDRANIRPRRLPLGKGSTGSVYAYDIMDYPPHSPKCPSSCAGNRPIGRYLCRLRTLGPGQPQKIPGPSEQWFHTIAIPATRESPSPHVSRPPRQTRIHPRAGVWRGQHLPGSVR
jgi:hypothetical protein